MGIWERHADHDNASTESVFEVDALTASHEVRNFLETLGSGLEALKMLLRRVPELATHHTQHHSAVLAIALVGARWDGSDVRAVS